ncbi:hypothetical protein J4N42_21800 [Vibrio sp. SCSIO 43135]|uniref:hypothetical protein n=1 Tax=Vibrio sp. SCSIO 43135 TaxID=2819096 RepID=UPI0020758C19|nr:hypothetical protein [Vibrio sp. SCSIO 43135]USD43226.1 hypothetical protein J4N42_21800 [Vibrio sp. SCSIO 43135]
MEPPHIAIDSSYKVLENEAVTSEVIDSYIQMTSMNMLDVEKRIEHVLELITYRMDYWERLIDGADSLLWIKSKGHGWAMYKQNDDCGYIRLYRLKPSPKLDHRRDSPWTRGNWVMLNSERELFNLIDSQEANYVFNAWKEHKLKVLEQPTKLAEGRLANTSVEQVIVASKGDGCAICGDKATHRAATTMGDDSAVMIEISLCKSHEYDVNEHSCVLAFFGTLFFLNLEIPDLIMLDHIPDELIEPIFSIISSNLEATFTPPKKGNNGWESRFVMDDGWYWLLRLNNLKSYAYMLFDDSNKQLHRIDSAPDHPDLPFGPDHQHINPTKKNHKIEPSFTYGIPLFDFPLLHKSKRMHQNSL